MSESIGESRRTLEYATSASRPAVSLGLFWTTVWCCAVAAGVGLLILISYYATRLHWLPATGLLWLALGGLTDFIAFICGVIFAVRALRNQCRRPATSMHVALALALPWAVGIVAYVCANLGIQMMSHHF